MEWPWSAARKIRRLQASLLDSSVALTEARFALELSARRIAELEGLVQRQQEEAIKAAKGST